MYSEGDGIMARKISLILLFIMISIFATACKKETTILSYPEKIIIYRNGTKQVLKQSNPSFKNIIMLTNKRFNNIYTDTIDVDDKCIQKAKDDGIDIEFIYAQEQEFNVVAEGVKQFKYTRLFFPLSAKNDKKNRQYLMYYGNGKKYLNNPIVNLSPSEDLIKIIGEL